MSKLKYQRIEVKYPVTTTPGVKKDHTLILDPEMDRVVGVFIHPHTNWDDPFRIGLSDNSGEIQEPTHYKDWQDNGYGDYYARKKPLDIEARGRKITIAVDVMDNLNSEIAFDMVFILKKDD